jgi:hypothetical protein
MEKEKDEAEQLDSLKILIEGVKMAQKRGAFTLEESAKLWTAIKKFIDD